ncbi:MAG: FAD-dependent oxidoreductase, partial [Actinomycetota bacterium]|nr:FAD-dependent oxidoreductase [Actinomycetota bacterium]
AWVAGLSEALSPPLPPLPPLEVTREQWFHFRPRRDDVDRWPSFVHHLRPDATPAFVYGLRTPDEGVKVAEHHTGAVVDPDRRRFEVEPEGAHRLRGYVEEWLPGLDPTSGVGTTCLYTSTASEDFVLDRAGPVVVASPCSGHGFKFTPEVGRLLADLADGLVPAQRRFTLAAHGAGRARPVHHR